MENKAPSPEDRLKVAEEGRAVAEIRLSLSQAFIQLAQQAYDALLYHGVNYRSLPSYTDDNPLDEAAKLPIRQAREKIISWIGKVKSDIQAAIRRKGFKVH